MRNCQFIANWQEGLAKSFKQDDISIMESGQAILAKDEPPIKLSDGKMAYYVSDRVPIKNAQGEITGILGISFNITELKETKIQLEEALKKAEEAGAELEKTLQRYTAFVNDQEHDIRTPVGGLASGVQAVVPLVKTDPDAALEILGFMRKSAQEVLEYQESLLYDLYQGSRPGISVFIRFDLADIVQRIYDVNLAAAKTKELSYTYDYDESIPNYLLGDGKRVYQCLLDLLSNAVRFTMCGSVHLAVKCLNRVDNKVVIRFTVTDTGIGIPADKQQDIYDAFVKLTPSNRGGERGRGLGLTRVNQYATQVGGELRFESSVGKGSCFILVLPFTVSIDQEE